MLCLLAHHQYATPEGTVSNGYHDAPACEHRYPDGQVCGEAAAFVSCGALLCEPHFEDVVTAASMLPDGERRAAEIRFAAQAVPA
jgi:hypothetical protein